MTHELETLALSRMVALLHGAGQSRRVYQVFESDRWLLLHLRDPKQGWAGYASDLTLAFDSLDRDIARGSAPAGESVLRLVRLCMIRSALTSSTDIPEGVLHGAVRSGAWQGEDITSAIERYADRNRQASAYVSLLRSSMDTEGRTSVQRALTALAFVRPDQMPTAELLCGIPLLGPPDRGAVADRLALCRMEPLGRFALRGRGSGPGVLSAVAVVKMMAEVPEARRPALVKRAVDTLLEEADRISRNAQAEYADPLDTATTLQDVATADLTEVTYGDYRRRPRVLAALATAAEFLPAYPSPDDLPAAFASCVGSATSAEEWSAFSASCAAGLHEAGVPWEPPAYVQAACYTSPLWRRDQDRLWWQWQVLLRSSLSKEGPQWEDERDHIGYLTLEEVQSGWVQRALGALKATGGSGLPAAPPLPPIVPTPQQNEETPAESGSLAMDAVMRSAAPFVAAMSVALSGKPAETVDEFIPAVFDDGLLDVQLLSLDNAVRNEQLDPELAGRTMGGLLRHALDSAHRAGGMRSAWTSVDTELITAADLTPVVDFVLGLPTEPERNHASGLFQSHEAEVRDVPLLAALETVVDHLDTRGAVRLADALLSVRSTPVRNRGLNILATRLPRETIERVLALSWRPGDSREQVWALREIAAGCPADATERAVIEEMAVAAADGIEDGWAYADALLNSPGGNDHNAAAVIASPEVLAAVRRLSVNNRTDALCGLCRHAGRDQTVPAALFEEILKLPAVNAFGTYSWRAVALVTCAESLDAAMAGQALDSAMELPERFTGGSSEAWGRDWTTEFLRAAVVHALAPALSPSDARRAFDYAKGLPYLAREPLFRTLAKTADAALARLLFDHTVECYRGYLQLDDSAPPREVEQVVSMEEPAVFLMHRQVQSAEIIAAVVDRLDGARRAVAAEVAMGFSASGPCAWLGAAVLNHLQERDEVNVPLLTGAALADAYGYVTEDPARIDLLIDLLPHADRHTVERQAELAEFVAPRFPDLSEPFLDEARQRSLDPHDLAEYRRLTGEDHLSRLGQESSDGLPQAEARRRMADWILSPFARRLRNDVLREMLLASPVLSRIHALSRLSEVLPEKFHTDVLTASVRQLVDHAPRLGEDDLAALTQVVEHLPGAERGVFLDVVAALPEAESRSAAAVEAEFLEEIYQDWGGFLRPHPRYEENSRSVVAQLIGSQLRGERFRSSVHFMTSRVRFLAQLAPYLPQDDVMRAVLLLRDFPEPERAEGLAVLLPVADETTARLVHAEVQSLESRFARLWVLWRAQDALRDAGTDTIAPAEENVASFDTPSSVGAAALLMTGHLGADRTFDIILDQAGKAGAAGDDEALLKLMTLAVRIGKEARDRKRLSDLPARLSTPKARYQALLMFGRAGMRLSDCLHADGEDGGEAVALLTAVSLRLSELSTQPRTQFLRALSGEMAALTGFLDSSEQLALARIIRQVCDQWRWP
ncbi:hypothetical protein [Streptomyces sp. NPDC057438]|uniref:hypothetical protein n=1 Tax=Streptomyces sp. NPDC057438 TaxID=3346133 RepID=UPI0036C800C7